MKFYCAPPASLPATLPSDFILVSLFDSANREGVGSAGTGIFNKCKEMGLVPSKRAVDLLSIALGVVSADNGCSRKTSPDGWTRELMLTVAVIDPCFWNAQRSSLEQLLRFLTGDIWSLSFIPGGFDKDFMSQKPALNEDAVTLLSGGMDSLIGAIDLSGEGEHLVAVSQISKGDAKKQHLFAEAIPGGLRHFQVNHNVRLINGVEISQRSRSFIFIAFGVLAATSLSKYHAEESVNLYIPENGFISLNIPLTPLRVGSLSTRTTHPYYIKCLQALLHTAGLRVNLVNPYQFKTKGEMLVNCLNQSILKKYASTSTSCGRFGRYFSHCGKCVPCLVRRAAIFKWGQKDETLYRSNNLMLANSRAKSFDDVRSVGMAVKFVQMHGLDRWIGQALSTAQIGDLTQYKDTAKRGLAELAAFLAHTGAL